MSVALKNESSHEMRNGVASVGNRLRGDERSFMLPLGLVDRSGQSHREVQLRPITGYEQQLLASLSPFSSVAEITTQLLARCVYGIGSIRTVDVSLIRALVVGDREYLLLRLYQTTFGETIHALLRCPSEECANVSEVPLQLESFTVEAIPVESWAYSESLESNETKKIVFRLPTGADQEALTCDVHLAEA